MDATAYAHRDALVSPLLPLPVRYRVAEGWCRQTSADQMGEEPYTLYKRT